MGSFKETNESGCRNMPGTGIYMIVVEFISSSSREIILSYYIYYISKVEENSFLHKASMLYFCLHKIKKLKKKFQTPVIWELSIVIWALFESLKRSVFSLS